jgi:hypothetical protein
MRIPDWSRRTWIAVGVVAVGAVVIVLALVGGSGGGSSSTDASSGSSSEDLPQDVQTDLTPSPIPTDDFGKGSSKTPLLDTLKNPFSAAYGSNIPHKVTVTVKADGAMRFAVRFRDGKGTIERVVAGGYSVTRTVKGPFPIAQVGMQNGPDVSAGSCSITIDGVQFSHNPAKGRFGVAVCLG